MNTLFDDEIRGHHSMRDLVLTLVSDTDLDVAMPGANPPLGDLLVQAGDLQGAYARSFETLVFDRTHRGESPARSVASLRDWFAEHDAAMKSAIERFSETQLQDERIDRGDGLLVSPFVQRQIYREAVYILYGKLSVYLRSLRRDAGPDWAEWIG